MEKPKDYLEQLNKHLKELDRVEKDTKNTIKDYTGKTMSIVFMLWALWLGILGSFISIMIYDNLVVKLSAYLKTFVFVLASALFYYTFIKIRKFGQMYFRSWQTLKPNLEEVLRQRVIIKKEIEKEIKNEN